MRVLVFGHTGMLGHQVFKRLLAAGGVDTFGVARSSSLANVPKDRQSKFVSLDHIETIFENFNPNFVVNCAGIIKQNLSAVEPDAVVEVNALLPHRLARLCKSSSSRLIQISTDCVFDGVVGEYSEKDIPNATDLYGQSKALGEVLYGDHITLRTSIIGHELFGRRSLLEWFLACDGEVDGYLNAFFSGVTTNTLAEVILRLMDRSSFQSGLFNVASSRISKAELLELIRKVYGLKTKINPVSEPLIDRSLIGTKFDELGVYQIPSWDAMITEMFEDRNGNAGNYK